MAGRQTCLAGQSGTTFRPAQQQTVRRFRAEAEEIFVGRGQQPDASAVHLDCTPVLLGVTGSEDGLDHRRLQRPHNVNQSGQPIPSQRFSIDEEVDVIQFGRSPPLQRPKRSRQSKNQIKEITTSKLHEHPPVQLSSSSVDERDGSPTIPLRTTNNRTTTSSTRAVGRQTTGSTTRYFHSNSPSLRPTTGHQYARMQSAGVANCISRFFPYSMAQNVQTKVRHRNRKKLHIQYHFLMLNIVLAIKCIAVDCFKNMSKQLSYRKTATDIL